MCALRLRILIISPDSGGIQRGNAVTSTRWAGILRRLGHEVALSSDYKDEAIDLMLALHARHSAGAARRFRQARPQGRLIVALTGTDLYGHGTLFDDEGSQLAHSTMDLADALVVLQPAALDEIPSSLRPRAQVIYQSLDFEGPTIDPDPREFRVFVLATLRELKDPLAAARAAARLPSSSRISVLHVGGVIDTELESEVRAAESRNPRYRWLGEQPRERALGLLAGSRALVHTSRFEGGANAVTEAVALSIPVLATDIPGNTGLLGNNFPGLVTPGDDLALTALLHRLEVEPGLHRQLVDHTELLARNLHPKVELRAWEQLVNAVFVTP